MSRASKLLEAKMTTQEAIKILELEGRDYNPDVVKKQYLSLSRKNHPDVGGDAEKMKLINSAYDLLKKATGFGVAGVEARRAEREEQKKRDLATLEGFKKELEKAFSIETLYNHFEPFMGSEVKKSEDVQVYNDRYYSTVRGIYRLESLDGESTVYFRVSLSLYQQKGGLSAGGVPELQISIDREVFANNRKNKMARRDWDSTDLASLNKGLTKLFPKKKLNDIFTNKKKGKFSKKDAFSFIRNKIKPDRGGSESFQVNLEGGMFLEGWRHVMMRQASWSLYLKRRGENGTAFLGSTGFVGENEKGMEFVLDLIKQAKKLKKSDQLIALAKNTNEFLKSDKAKYLYESSELSRAGELLEFFGKVDYTDTEKKELARVQAEVDKWTKLGDEIAAADGYAVTGYDPKWDEYVAKEKKARAKLKTLTKEFKKNAKERKKKLKN